MLKVLFICKRRPLHYGMSFGLLNSCRFLCNALRDMGVEADVIEVTDNNFIDKEVHKYNPTHVFIEALWIVPSKFPVLIKLYPNIKWYVRLHSNVPFISNEGTAMEWIIDYGTLQSTYYQFNIAPNSLRMVEDLERSLGIPTIYAPNIYQPDDLSWTHRHSPIDENATTINVGCFGAIRPLKNQLMQAMAAMAFANETNKTLCFHVNYSRIENHGENTYKNIKELFEESKHKIIIHEWIDHDKFLALIETMDFGLQVSFSETFNIVAADFVHLDVPVIGSKEIEWMDDSYKANPTSLDDIVHHIREAWDGRTSDRQSINIKGLKKYNKESRKVWRNLLGI